jgi:hypothetical protein
LAEFHVLADQISRFQAKKIKHMEYHKKKRALSVVWFKDAAVAKCSKYQFKRKPFNTIARHKLN